MTDEPIVHSARLWCWSQGGKGRWHFLTIDGAAGDALAATALMRRLELGRARGFGSVRLDVAIGGTRWRTSAFPEKGGHSWVLPVKKPVLRAEDIGEGDEVTVKLEPV